MAVVELACPRCSAPVDGSVLRGVVACRYCGAAITVAGAAAGRTKTVFVISVDRVAPSNRARVVEALRTFVAIGVDDAARLVDASPCEIAALDDEMLAEQLRQMLYASGVVARLQQRQVVVPEPVMLPERTVVLDHAGPNKLAVIKALREHLDIDLAAAKALVDRAPSEPARLEGARAQALVTALTNAGATARLR